MDPLTNWPAWLDKFGWGIGILGLFTYAQWKGYVVWRWTHDTIVKLHEDRISELKADGVLWREVVFRSQSTAQRAIEVLPPTGKTV